MPSSFPIKYLIIVIFSKHLRVHVHVLYMYEYMSFLYFNMLNFAPYIAITTRCVEVLN